MGIPEQEGTWASQHGNTRRMERNEEGEDGGMEGMDGRGEKAGFLALSLVFAYQDVL